MMLSSKKSDPGSSASASSMAPGGEGASETQGGTQTASSASAVPGLSDVKKKERASPSGEPGGPPMPHPASAGAQDQENRRTSRRKKAKVAILYLLLALTQMENLPVFFQTVSIKKGIIILLVMEDDHTSTLRRDSNHETSFLNLFLFYTLMYM